ncbi:hypothetical protein PSm6_48450 [Pseudomonas solani]|uniref:Uncharacterized protein n=1 Tax=Pseudomonas solani TaxID=2731552 RepID=A0AAU7XUR8_9PSED|nr:MULTISPECIES: hypothetical protein [Pseudomonas]EQM67970.1 hypothetical protein L682_20140 [Pseudomonas alcaligenes OT 69]MBB4819401.1 hypothetical protein [Pseudomonas alcaligenes]MDN4149371.1 hypothetical protein [Pseudomonas tohonis]MDU9416111.1 hypothetical protein [Pseudomonas sp. zfem005]BCD88438.1 hypothetical protein PSm6_48450 [Pseudomonas solani]
MFRDFKHCTAWTDAMREGQNYVGLIEYQPKREGAGVRVLWVLTPGCVCENEAETAADNMLREIRDITVEGSVIYSDGVAL